MQFSKELLNEFRRFVMLKYHEACDNLKREVDHRERKRYIDSPHYQKSVETKIMLAMRERDKWFRYTQEFRSQTFTILRVSQIFENSGAQTALARQPERTTRSSVFTLKPKPNPYESQSAALEAFLADEAEKDDTVVGLDGKEPDDE